MSLAERKERISQSTAALHALFRKISNEEIGLEELLDGLHDLGLDETPALMSFLAKRESSSFKFKDFLSTLSTVPISTRYDDSARTSYNGATPSGSYVPRSEGLFGGMSDADDFVKKRGGRVSSGGGAYGGAAGGVSAAMNFETSVGSMYETSSGTYGSYTPVRDTTNEPSRYVPSRDVENERPSVLNAEKTSSYSYETKSLSCPWGTENDAPASGTRSVKHKPQPATGAWFGEATPVTNTRGRSNVSAPIWGTDRDM